MVAVAKGFGRYPGTKMVQSPRQRSSPSRELRKLITGPYNVAFTTGRRRGVAGAKEQAFGDPPPTWMGTLPEWALYWAANTLGMKEGEHFAYQYFLDPGMIVDFYFYNEQTLIEIQGLYWHYMQGGYRIELDLDRKVRAESIGLTLIFIDEDDALENPIRYLREALAGRDHSRVMRGA